MAFTYRNLKSMFANSTYSQVSLDHIVPLATMCSVCVGGPSPANSSTMLSPVQHGMVSWLPSWEKLANAGDFWCVGQQTKALSQGAYNHPCIVLKSSTCGHLVYCAPCTSFAGQGLDRKFSRANEESDVFYRYMAIRGAQPVAQKSGLPELEFSTPGTMKKPTYACLGQGFWIERWALDEHRVNGQVRILSKTSLSVLKWAHQLVQYYHDTRQHVDQILQQFPSHCQPTTYNNVMEPNMFSGQEVMAMSTNNYTEFNPYSSGNVMGNNYYAPSYYTGYATPCWV